MKTSPIALGIALIFTPLARAAPSAAEIISAAGVKGGLIVHLGAGEGTLTAALRLNEGYMVQGLDVDAASDIEVYSETAPTTCLLDGTPIFVFYNAVDKLVIVSVTSGRHELEMNY